MKEKNNNLKYITSPFPAFIKSNFFDNKELEAIKNMIYKIDHIFNLSLIPERYLSN